MIPVDLQQEPAVFEASVRAPGRRFLSRTPNPTSKQFTNHSYWRRILKELHDAYGGICAYSCHWIPYDTGADTVEHFRAKTLFPRQAYEWDNYRLVCATLNGRKGIYDDVLDPFDLENDWFVIDFPSLLVKPAAGLEAGAVQEVLSTINRLGLNEEGTCWRGRERYVRNFCKKCITFEFLREEAPFIAHELDRQRLVDNINDIMGYPLDPCVL